MDWNRHVRIGAAALARGKIRAETLAQIMIEVGLRSEEPHDEDCWLGAGRLSRGDLDEIVAAVDQDREGEGGRYRPLGALGEGGMGRVDECLDVALGRKVARKRLRVDLPPLDFDPGEALEREARIAASLEHPNIVPVYDIGRDRGAPYYVMRIAQGASLADLLVRLSKREPDALEAYSPGRLMRMFVQVCNAVAYAHDKGFVHRDLKPGNVLLGTFGEVLVVDWGLAERIGEPPARVTGTPGYMAPETLIWNRPLDPRSDVFALGAILYECLALTPALDHQNAKDMVLAAQDDAGYAIVPPSLRSGPWPLSPDLDEICAKAMAKDPARRYARVEDLARAVEELLEGTRERERRKARADALVESAAMLAESYRELLAERPRRLEELTRLRASIDPWAPIEQKQALWDAEEAFAVMDGLATRTFQSVVATYEQALDEVPTHEEGRAQLARLYGDELRRAQERRDSFDRVHFEERIRQLVTTTVDDALLRVETTPGATVRIARYEEQGRRLVAGAFRDLGRAPLEPVRIPAGSWLLSFAGPSLRAPVIAHVLVRAGDELAVQLEPVDVGDGEILIPGGPALIGGDEDLDDLREVIVPSFAIQRRPVTFAEYFEFLAEARAKSPSIVEDYLPRAEDGAPLFELSRAGRDDVRPARASEWGDDGRALLSLPVVGVDAWSAEAYAAWRSRKTKRVYHLPTEIEWEKAARGVDGRRYPWGDKFDPSFCKMRESRPGRPRLEPSGAFEVDVSPYGVVDMAGGVADWTTSAAWRARDEADVRRLASRGGSFRDARLDCRVTSRRPYLADERSSRVGFRLARTVATKSSLRRIAGGA